MSLKRCKKVAVMLFTVGLILGLMNPAQAQLKSMAMPKSPAQPKSGFGAKLGYFMPGDEDVKLIWGSGFIFGVDYLYAFPPYGIDFGVEYFSKEEEKTAFGITSKAEWRVIPLTATFLYFFSNCPMCLMPMREGLSAYIGVGIGYYLTRVDVETPLAGIPLFAGNAEESGIGFHVQGGFALGKNFFAEVKYSTVGLKGDIDKNAGGFTIFVGYRL
jgi:hypothetical protein